MIDYKTGRKGCIKITIWMILIALLSAGGAAAVVSDFDSVLQSPDGKYILFDGRYTEGPYKNSWLIKTDVNGVEQSNKTFGGKNNKYSYFIQTTSDKGYIAVETSPGSGDAMLVKMDANGSQEWNKTFGGEKGDYAFSVKQTTDGGYVLAGRTYSYGAGGSDAWLIKTDVNGNEEWNKTFGKESDDYAFSVRQTADEGYVLAGGINLNGTTNDAWLIKTDKNGNQEWNKTFGGEKRDDAFSVQQTADGGYVLTGRTNSYGAGLSDAWLIKTDENGSQQWNKTFGGKKRDYAYSVVQTSEGGYVLAGESYSYGAGGSDAWLIKTDENGSQQWNKTFGGKNRDYALSVRQTSDGNYILTGGTDYWDDSETGEIEKLLGSGAAGGIGGGGGGGSGGGGVYQVRSVVPSTYLVTTSDGDTGDGECPEHSGNTDDSECLEHSGNTDDSECPEHSGNTDDSECLEHSGSTDDSECPDDCDEETTTIPEFPTIAFPIVSVMAIMLLFLRRRDR